MKQQLLLLWVALIGSLIIVYITIAAVGSKLDLKVNQLKDTITGPPKNESWNGGHVSMTIVKHSPNCQCLK